MADGSADIIRLRTSREIAWKAGLRVVEAPSPPPVIDLDGNRVLIHGARAMTFMATSNAIRSAEALSILAELGWPIERLVEPTTPHEAA